MKKRFLVVSLILIMVVCFMQVKVQADSFRFGMKADKTNLKAKETVTISLSVNDINAGELGINTVEGTFIYDSNIFEEVKTSDFTSSNGWSITYNAEESEQKGKMLGVILQTGVKENQEIGKVKLKVKENAKAGSTTVKITNIRTNNGSELIQDSDKTVSIKIEKTEESNNDSNNNNNNNNNTDNSNNNNNKNKNNNTKNNTSNNSTKNSSKKTSNKKSTTTKKAEETKSKIKLPYTGKANFILIIIALLFISIFTYKKYKSIDK